MTKDLWFWLQSKLKPCPNCGGVARMMPTFSECFVVDCTSCDYGIVVTEVRHPRKAVVAWNKKYAQSNRTT